MRRSAHKFAGLVALTALLVHSAVDAFPRPPQPLIELRFDGALTVATGLLSAGATITASSGAALTTDRFGRANRALHLPAGNALRSNALALPSANTVRSLCTWFRTTGATGFQSFGEWGAFATNSRFGTMLSTTGFVYVVGQGDDYSCAAGSALNTGVWQHVCTTWDGTNVRVYANGALTCTGVPSVGSYNTAITTPLSIGRTVDNTISQTEFFDGDIDTWQVFGTALTADQVKYVFNEPPQPLIELKFDGGLTANSTGYLTGVSISATAGVSLTADRYGRPNRAAQVTSGNCLRSELTLRGACLWDASASVGGCALTWRMRTTCGGPAARE